MHKSTHHFDLVNFWLGTKPETVFAFGKLNFYGKQNAERRGVKNFYYRCYGSEQAKNDPFAIDLEGNELFRELYLKAEKDSGYIRDRSVFGDDISIEDTMSVLVRYQNGAQLSYSLNSYMPWEGYIVSFNGSKGRIEYQVREQAYINGGGERAEEGAQKLTSIMVYPMFANPYPVEVKKGVGSHGGGDTVLLNDIFGTPEEDKFHRAASHIDGAMSILTGVAANKSIASGLPVSIGDLVKL